MTEPVRDAAIRGKTIRFRWTEGPTKGKTYEHVFHEDGTVEWHEVEPSKAGQPTEAGRRETPERPPYAAVKVADEAFVVSYLSAAGYTLTAVLNFQDQQLIGFASSAKDWFPVRGTFEVVRSPT